MIKPRVTNINTKSTTKVKYCKSGFLNVTVPLVYLEVRYVDGAGWHTKLDIALGQHLFQCLEGQCLFGHRQKGNQVATEGCYDDDAIHPPEANNKASRLSSR